MGKAPGSKTGRSFFWRRWGGRGALLAALAAAQPAYAADQAAPATDRLRSYGVLIKNDDDGLKTALFSKILPDPEFAAAMKIVTDPGLHVQHLQFSALAGKLPALHDMPDLRVIDLSYTAVQEIGDLSHLDRLETINLYGARQMTALPPLHDLPSLRLIEASDSAVRSIGALTNLPRLKMLELSDDDELMSLPPLHDLPALAVIMANHSGLARMGELSHLPSLKTLAVAATGLTALPQMTDLPALKSIDAHQTKLTDTAELRDLPQLQMLDLSSTERLQGLTLRDLPAIEVVNVSLSNVATLDFKNLSALHCVNMTNTTLLSLPTLSGTTAPYPVFDTRGTKIANPKQGVCAPLS